MSCLGWLIPNGVSRKCREVMAFEQGIVCGVPTVVFGAASLFWLLFRKVTVRNTCEKGYVVEPSFRRSQIYKILVAKIPLV
jgi:hypothetical protein